MARSAPIPLHNINRAQLRAAIAANSPTMTLKQLSDSLTTNKPYTCTGCGGKGTNQDNTICEGCHGDGVTTKLLTCSRGNNGIISFQQIG